MGNEADVNFRRYTVKKDGKKGHAYWFWCEGCEENHRFALERAEGEQDGPVWNWDGNEEEPTFYPSLLVRLHKEGGPPGLNARCHLVLRKGMVQYLKDCTHTLAGKIVPVAPSRF